MPDPRPGPTADTDRNLLLGVLALQADLLDAARFAEACSAWAGRKDTPLADLLVQRGCFRDPSLLPLQRKEPDHATRVVAVAGGRGGRPGLHVVAVAALTAGAEKAAPAPEAEKAAPATRRRCT
jgi:hypothetical protein